MTAAVIRLVVLPRPGDVFELRNRLGTPVGRFVRVDSVFRARTGRAMVVCVREGGDFAGEPITVEFVSGAQSGWRHEYGMSDISVARGRAEQWQRLVETGEVEHGDEDEEGGVA